MKKVFLYFFIPCCLILPIHSQAQQTVFEETRVLYHSEMAGGLILHTSGWGVNFIYAEHVSGFRRKVYEAELVSMRHEREIKTLSDFQNIRGYFYGKLNTLNILRTSMGIQNIFIPKQSVRGVSISYDFNYGISHGFVKPVYLSVGYSDDKPSFIAEEIRNEKYDPDLHFPDHILGRSSFFRGFGEIKYYPGIFAKFGLNFEYSSDSDIIKAMEVGVTVDAFYRKIPIMAFNENQQAFYAIYFNFLYGKRRTAGEIKEKKKERRQNRAERADEG